MLFVPILSWQIGGALQAEGSLSWIKWGIFVAGLLTLAEFSFWGNYIPLVFPCTCGTGKASRTFGEQVFGTAAAFITISMSAGQPVAAMAKSGGIVAGVYAPVGVVLTFWLRSRRLKAWRSDVVEVETGRWSG